jgi:hypothetical protein
MVLLSKNFIYMFLKRLTIVQRVLTFHPDSTTYRWFTYTCTTVFKKNNYGNNLTLGTVILGTQFEM